MERNGMIAKTTTRFLVASAAFVALAAFAPAASAGSKVDIIVTSEGVGGINSKTPFDAEALRALLPGYEVSTKTASDEGMASQVLVVRLDGKDMIEIDGDAGKVFTMRIVGAGISDDRGMTIGSSTFADYKGSVEDGCMAVEQRNGTDVVCQSEILALSYSFASPAEVKTDSDGILHRSGVPAESLLTRMLWYPMD
jgi:hypothetical protein